MTYKWNPVEAGNYAKAFSAYLCDEFFKSQDRIGGQEILQFSEIKQLNLFLIKNLYSRWQAETERLKSPFFDFESKDVKEALEQFMNVLSRNISVGREAFEGLLNRATLETLQLCMEPRAYFESTLRDLPEFKLTTGWIEENLKYYVVGKEVMGQLSEYLNGSEKYANEAIAYLPNVSFEDDLDSRFEILDAFEKIKPLMLRKEEPGKSFFEDLLKEHTIPAKPQKVTETQTVNLESRVNHLPKEPVAVNFPPQVEEVTARVENLRLNERLVNGNKTLNEKIISEAKSLLDLHQKRKITSLKEGISLNQRFLFINNLFGGDHQAFALALEELEQFDDIQAARSHVTHQLAVKYKWQKSSEEAGEFFAHLERKFS